MMALSNSMGTKTWLFEKTAFTLRFGQNGRGAKALSQTPWRYEPSTKAIWRVESMEDIVYRLV